MAKRYCAFDVGHGGVDSGAVNGNRYEKNDALKLACAVEEYVEKMSGGVMDCQKSRTKDKYLSLEERCQWQKRHPEYEFFVSFHRDSWETPNPHGSHIIVYRNGSKQSNDLAKCVAKRLNPIMKGRAEGITHEGIYVLHHTSCPAILIECGFITNKGDNEIFDKEFNRIVKAIGDGIMEYAKLKYVETEKPKPEKPKPEKPKPTNQDTMYRVVAGTYKNRHNAENMQNKLKKNGVDSFLVAIKK